MAEKGTNRKPTSLFPIFGRGGGGLPKNTKLTAFFAPSEPLSGREVFHFQPLLTATSCMSLKVPRKLNVVFHNNTRPVDDRHRGGRKAQLSAVVLTCATRTEAPAEVGRWTAVLRWPRLSLGCNDPSAKSLTCWGFSGKALDFPKKLKSKDPLPNGSQGSWLLGDPTKIRGPFGLL